MLNELKSIYVLNKIFSKMKNRIILKIIKYNKLLMNRLNITKEDFMEYKSLQEFNEKLELNIRDIDIEELDLSKRSIDNENIKYRNIRKSKFGKIKKIIFKL